MIQWANGYGSGTLDVGRYPGGEPLVSRFPKNGMFDRILVRAQSVDELMAALFFVDAYVERGHAPPSLILPYVPGARQDRLNDAGDYLFTAKSVAKEINARGFPSVTIIDPHSEVISALIDRCNVVHAHECLRTWIAGPRDGGYTAVVSPDAGAEKRALAAAKLLGVPLLHGWKTRDVATGEITGFGLEPTKDPGHVLVVDDICDGGGTFLGLSGVLAERLIKADLYTTHGIYSQGTARLARGYFRIICTDSIVGREQNVEVIHICERLLAGERFSL